MPKMQTHFGQQSARPGKARPCLLRKSRRTTPFLDPLEERCLLSMGSPLVFDTGASNGAVAIGDINGDGIPDVVTATTAGAINIALGNGDGTFERSAPIAPLGTSFSSVVLADLDGQHGLDIAAADPNADKVWVLLNYGDGTFGSVTALATGSQPMDVVAADFGNGHVDIATANSGDSTVSVFTGNGDGTFLAQRKDFPVGAMPLALAAGDLNRDGHPDIVTTNLAGNSITVLRSKGDGSFRSALDIPITVVIKDKVSRDSGPVDVAIGDFNGDGNLDIATANSGTASVSTLIGKSVHPGSIRARPPISKAMRVARDRYRPHPSSSSRSIRLSGGRGRRRIRIALLAIPPQRAIGGASAARWGCRPTERESREEASRSRAPEESRADRRRRARCQGRCGSVLISANANGD